MPASEDANPDPWSQLAVRAASGDTAAFKDLLDHLEPRLVRYYRSQLSRVGRRDLGEADELAQRTAVELWRVLERRAYDPARAAVATLAFAISRNLWLRYLRDGRRSGRVYAADADDHEPGVEDSTSALLVEVEALERLEGCVRRLKADGDLSELDLSILDGLLRGDTERDIAARSEAASSTVHDRKKALMGKLRLCMEVGPDSSGQ